MKKFFATMDYIFTITFTIIHIFFVVLTMNLSHKTEIEALATSITYQKILLVITILYLIVFIFIGNPVFYKSKAKKRFKKIISFIKNIFYILNSIFIIQISIVALNMVGNISDLSASQQIVKLHNALALFGINGFYVFYMYITLIVSTFKILIGFFGFCVSIQRSIKYKKKLKERQMHAN